VIERWLCEPALQLSHAGRELVNPSREVALARAMQDLQLEAVGIVQEQRVVARRVTAFARLLSISAPLRSAQAAHSSTSRRLLAEKAM
jgi:hypothetical protein